MLNFSQLSTKLTKVIQNLTGKGRITPENIETTLRDIRVALLEADVALSVAVDFINDIKDKALGQEVLSSLTPGQALIKLVHDELVKVMGDGVSELNLKTQPPAIMLLAGLQGSGKTTTTAKLAYWLKTNKNKSVLVASLDIYRPAANAQLATLAHNIDIKFFDGSAINDPVAIAHAAIKTAKQQLIDVLLLDTAGRLHIDDDMMQEIKNIHQATNPIETLFVLDSMTGQDAVNTAKAFDMALPLTGIILTKADGDARGGAALSVRRVTGKPIKFIGVGEKTDALQPFYPERIASSILGMGDIVSLVENVQKNIDHDAAKKLTAKLNAGKRFDLSDYRDQIKQINRIGGLQNIVSKLPISNNMSAAIKDIMPEKKLGQFTAIIDSMTLKERRFPEHIKGSHKRRIAQGSGTSIQTINQLLKQFTQMQRVIQKAGAKGGLKQLMRDMTSKFSAKGGMPSDFPF